MGREVFMKNRLPRTKFTKEIREETVFPGRPIPSNVFPSLLSPAFA